MNEKANVLAAVNKWDFYALDTYNPKGKIEEKQQYLIKRARWISQYIIDNFDYNTFSYFNNNLHTVKDKEYLDWVAAVRPCDFKEHQCSMFCSYYKGENNCGIN